MSTINLLPWREEQRAEAKQQFFVILGICAALGASAVYAVELSYNGKINDQQARNSFVEREVAKLDAQIKEIDELEKERQNLQERMELIQGLQGNRTVIVHHFDEVVRAMPEGVYLTRLEKKGVQFKVEGIADATSRVSNLMRNLEESDWFKKADLTRVTKVDDSDEESPDSFVLSVLEEKPRSTKDDEEG